MGISPIDLQTLYTQMDKVGKNLLSQQVALQQARDVAENDVRKAAEAKSKSVQKAETGENAVGKISDENAPSSEGDTAAKKEEKEAEKAESAKDSAASAQLDNGLGSHVDISV